MTRPKIPVWDGSSTPPSSQPRPPPSPPSPLPAPRKKIKKGPSTTKKTPEVKLEPAATVKPNKRKRSAADLSKELALPPAKPAPIRKSIWRYAWSHYHCELTILFSRLTMGYCGITLSIPLIANPFKEGPKIEEPRQKQAYDLVMMRLNEINYIVMERLMKYYELPEISVDVHLLWFVAIVYDECFDEKLPAKFDKHVGNQKSRELWEGPGDAIHVYSEEYRLYYRTKTEPILPPRLARVRAAHNALQNGLARDK